MMSSSEVAEIRRAGEDINTELRIDTHKLDDIENNGVNLQCVNSYEFMVGKQTNFNGPVTIINCTDGSDPGNFHGQAARKEAATIKDNAAAPPAATTVENFERKRYQNKNHEKEMAFKVKEICTKSFLKVPVFAWGLALFLILAGIITVITDLYSVDHGYWVGGQESMPWDDTIPDDCETIPGNFTNHTIFRRKHWKAAPEESSVLMKLPVPYVIVSSTGSKNCTSLRDCTRILQNIQEYQKKATRSDIYSNFLISSDGSIYEGRGWEKRNAFQGFANNQNLEIACIGEFFVYEQPAKSQIDAVESLIDYGIRNGKIRETYYLIPANATGISLQEGKPNIGKNLYEKIKNLPRFTPTTHSLFFLPVP